MSSEPVVAAQKAGGGRDRFLDGFRAVAVLAVIGGHAMAYRYSAAVEGNGFLLHQLGRLAASLADTGVYIFFAISGYIISTLMLREESRRGRFNLGAFYVRRSLRILPPFALYLGTVGFLAMTGYIALPLAHIGNAAAFTCNTGFTACSWFVAHTWSLAVEEQYYLIWPLLFTLMAAQRRRWFAAGVAVALILIFLLLPWNFHSNTVSFACIAAGAACALAPKWREALERAGGFWTCLLAALFVLVGPFLVGMKAVEAAMPLMALFLLFGARSSNLFRRLLESGPFQFVGSISYSLYLWQQLFLAAPDAFAGHPPPVWLLPIIAWLSMKMIEQPCMRLSHMLSRRLVEGGSKSPASTLSSI